MYYLSSSLTVVVNKINSSKSQTERNQIEQTSLKKIMLITKEDALKHTKITNEEYSKAIHDTYKNDK